jgi:hypothetical protein
MPSDCISSNRRTTKSGQEARDYAAAAGRCDAIEPVGWIGPERHYQHLRVLIPTKRLLVDPSSGHAGRSPHDQPHRQRQVACRIGTGREQE